MKTCGKLRYSPKPESENWFVFLLCDKELGKYYRNLFYLSKLKQLKLQRPAWDTHVTIVRNEEPSNKELWGKYDGLEVEFDYVPIVNKTGPHYYFNMPDNDFFIKIRTELGLDPNPFFPWHMSFGNLKWKNIDNEQGLQIHINDV